MVRYFYGKKQDIIKANDGIIEKIDNLSSESEMIINASTISRANRKKYLGEGDDIIEIQF